MDIGCGNGYVLNYYFKEGAIFHGIDITEKAIELTKKRFELNNSIGNFSIQDAQNLSFEDNYFDCVCSMGVLHHVPNTEKAISEIYRVLKPSGRLILMFYHKNSFKYHIKFRLKSILYNKSINQLVNEFDGLENPLGKAYSKNNLLELLSQFIDVDLSIGYLVPSDIIPKSNKFLPINLFDPLARYFGWNLYAKGYKPYK